MFFTLNYSLFLVEIYTLISSNPSLLRNRHQLFNFFCKALIFRISYQYDCASYRSSLLFFFISSSVGRPKIVLTYRILLVVLSHSLIRQITSSGNSWNHSVIHHAAFNIDDVILVIMFPNFFFPVSFNFFELNDIFLNSFNSPTFHVWSPLFVLISFITAPGIPPDKFVPPGLHHSLAPSSFPVSINTPFCATTSQKHLIYKLVYLQNTLIKNPQ